MVTITPPRHEADGEHQVRDVVDLRDGGASLFQTRVYHGPRGNAGLFRAYGAARFVHFNLRAGRMIPADILIVIAIVLIFGPLAWLAWRWIARSEWAGQARVMKRARERWADMRVRRNTEADNCGDDGGRPTWRERIERGTGDMDTGR